jgi:hypothetical protein
MARQDTGRFLEVGNVAPFLVVADDEQAAAGPAHRDVEEIGGPGGPAASSSRRCCQAAMACPMPSRPNRPPGREPGEITATPRASPSYRDIETAQSVRKECLTRPA